MLVNELLYKEYLTILVLRQSKFLFSVLQVHLENYFH